jgi:hypothetical protein
MSVFRYTLLADGSSDQVLMPIIDWLINQNLPDIPVVGEFARGFGDIGNDLETRARAALEYFPCDLLLIHRDAEGMSREQRLLEIDAVEAIRDQAYVAVIACRMTEAWLFSDEAAIRFAAENASGRHPINLPSRQRWERIPDPKTVLLDALCVASGKTGRALAKFNPEKARHLITPRTESFHRLRGLECFDAFELDLTTQLENYKYALD